MTADRDTASEALRPSQRHWRDIGLCRWALGLVVAPLGPIVLVSLPLTSLLGIFALVVGGTIAIAASSWSLLLGFGYLHTVARTRGRVGRTECILLGVFIAATLPSAAITAVYAFDEPGYFFGPFSSGGMSAVFTLSLLFAPFGGLGGWIFWRIGVYPTRTKLVNEAQVFD